MEQEKSVTQPQILLFKKGGKCDYQDSKTI